MTILEKRKYEELLEEAQNEDLAQKLYFRWKCLTDLYFLGAEIFGLQNAKDPGSGHKRLDPKMHKKMATELCLPGDKMLLYPRLHMKTTWVKIRICQLILIDPNTRIGLWSRTATLVRKELASIKHMMATPALRELFPEIPDPGKDFKNWQKSDADNLTVWRDPNNEYQPQENQVEVWGADSTVTGHHYDYHFYDDIIDDKSVRTSEGIGKTKSWWENVQAIKDIGAVETLTGTRKHYADIYGTIIAEKYFETVITHKAIEAGRPFYSFFTMEHLNKLKRRMGDWSFSCEMMNDVLPKSERLFMPPHPIYEKLPDTRMKYYITVDPAMSEKRWANWTGICVGAVPIDHPDKVYYVEAYRIKRKSNEVADEIVNKIAQYRPRRVGIEYGMQAAIQYIIDLKFKNKQLKDPSLLRPEYVAIPTGKMNKGDKIDLTLGAFVREQRALFRSDMHDLFNQMEFFNRHSEKNDDDILDAASMMIQTVENFSAAHWLGIQEVKGAPSLTWESLFAPKKPLNSWGRKFAS